MKIAIVRGDFASKWELLNFKPLSERHQLTLFTGLRPVADLSNLNWLSIVRLLSPVDLNFGTINRFTMAILNRVFVDAHALFGLEGKLRGFDIAHCAETYYYYTQQCIRAKECGSVKRLVSTVWENIPFNNEGILGRKAFKRNSLTNIDKFLAVSNGARQALITEGCPPQRIARLKPGVDLDIFYRRRITQYKNLRKNGNIKLLFIGRLVSDKGILELLEIFRQLRCQLPNIELVVVGDGPLRNQVKGLEITPVGQVPYFDVPNVLSLCDIFVHCPVGSLTWQEQYAMVLIEAMACGLPIVTVDSGGIPENVGEAALIANQGDFYSISAALKKFILSPRLRAVYAKKARERAVAKFDIKLGAAKLEKIYEEVLQRKE